MPRGVKRQKELARKKRLDEKRSRLASRGEEREASRAAASHAAGPRCEFCGGPLVGDEGTPPPDITYGGHRICQTCYDLVPQSEKDS
jgi:hypothetical protein